jgi:hypothetical protein
LMVVTKVLKVRHHDAQLMAMAGDACTLKVVEMMRWKAAQCLRRCRRWHVMLYSFRVWKLSSRFAWCDSVHVEGDKVQGRLNVPHALYYVGDGALADWASRFCFGGSRKVKQFNRAAMTWLPSGPLTHTCAYISAFKLPSNLAWLQQKPAITLKCKLSTLSQLRRSTGMHFHIRDSS